MKTSIGLVAFFLAFAFCLPATRAAAAKAVPASRPATLPATVDALTPEQQEKLLKTRLPGRMGLTFRDFSNMFLVQSHLNLGTGIGLMTSSKEIAAADLMSPFPDAYSPTLREFLDAIALQTSSEWKYDATGKYIKNEAGDKKPVKDLAIFEFTKANRKKPFAIKLADGWKSQDMGNWLMCRPPDFPVGMDIYEMGTYSSDKKGEKDFSAKIRRQVSLQWAERANRNAAETDLKPAKVGKYEALYYESMIPSNQDKPVKWRQWVFMVDDKCYFIVSTIFPAYEAKLFPEVQKMVGSFRAQP